MTRDRLGPTGTPTAKDLRQLDELAANLKKSIQDRKLQEKAKFQVGDKVTFIGPVEGGEREYGVVNKPLQRSEEGKLEYGVKVGKTQYYVFPRYLKANEGRPTSRAQSKAKQPVQLKEKSMASRKIQVSEAAENTQVLKRTKKLIKLVVAGVKISGVIRKVKFVARADKGIVVCRVPGSPALRIGREVNGKGRESFTCRVGREVIGAKKTPQKAFAMGVAQMWAVQ